MIEALEKYKESGIFVFKPEDKLTQVCKAVPNDKSGIYLIYGISNGEKELIYIGRSGQLLYGYPSHKKGGLRGRFTSGKQQFNYPVSNVRQIAWPKKMKDDEIDSLEVHWFVTLDETVKDCPMVLEKKLLQTFQDEKGDLPKWNRY